MQQNEFEEREVETVYLCFTCPVCGADNEVIYPSDRSGYFKTTCQKCKKRLGMQVHVKTRRYAVLDSYPEVLD